MQADLVMRAQAGDRDAFSMLAASAAARLFASARLILRQPDGADDAVQEALVEAWRGIRGLRDPERLDAWLHRLLVRSCHRHLRRDLRRRVTEIQVSDVVASSFADPAQSLANRDEMERAFRGLSDDHRAILALFYYADLSLADVAIALGIPIGTAKSRLHRAIAGLRAALAANERAIQFANGKTA